MSDVYQHCTICLGAPGSSGNSSGFYSDRPIDLFSSTFRPTKAPQANRLPLNCCLRVRPKSSLERDRHITGVGALIGHEPWSLFAREKLKHWPLVEPHWCSYVSRHHNPNTLRFRAWVFQERMLAPRFLHFLEQELAWDCQTRSLCECGWADDDIGNRTMGHRKLEFASELQTASASSIALMWRSVVSDYTELYLSFETDRLAAIAGIARAFGKKRGPNSQYHAGVWSDSVEQDLSWGIRFLEKYRKDDGTDWEFSKDTWGDGRGRHITRVEGIPTWSWASVSRSVHFIVGPEEHFESMCTVIHMGEARSISVPNNKLAFTQTLEIKGYLVPAKILYRSDDGGCREMFTLQFINEEDKHDFAYDDHLDLPGPSHVQSGEIVYYLLLGSYSAFEHEDTERLDPVHQTSCNLILKSVDRSQNLYHRIGSVTSPFKSLAEKLTEQSIVRIC